MKRNKRRRLRPLRFLIFLLLTFFLTFSLSGGLNIFLPRTWQGIGDFLPKLSYQPPAGRSDTDYNQISTLDRLSRLVFLRCAVNARVARDDYVSFAKLSPDLIHAVVAVEDRRFYEHHGIDFEYTTFWRTGESCDLSKFSAMTVTVMAPADENECRQMLSTGFHHEGPAAVRYPRGTGPGVAVDPGLVTLPIGKAQLRRSGSRIALLAFGATVPAAEQVGAELGLTVVNMRFVKPLDRALVLELAASHQGFVTVEDNVVAGGAGSAVSELLNAEGVLLPVLHLGLPDAFQHHASREDLLAEAGIDAAGIRAAVLKRWPRLADATLPHAAGA